MSEVIATFTALPFSAFSDAPGGSGDSKFVLQDADPSQLLTVTIYDDDPTIEGDNIVGETGDDDTQIAVITDSEGNIVATDVIYVEWTAEYESDDGDSIEIWRFETNDNLRLFAVSDMPEEGVDYYQQDKDMDPTGLDPDDIPQIPCLTTGTKIKTSRGYRSIETLRVGELVITADHGLQAIRWIGKREVSPAEMTKYPALRPVRIVAGALGNGLPSRDMLVSRQHRMLISSSITKSMIGTDAVLVPAVTLTALPGVYIETQIKPLTYYHLLFDRHEVIFAEDAPTESLYTGAQALIALPKAARQEIFALFPELSHKNYRPEPAQPLPDLRMQKRLVQRHAKNRVSALQRYKGPRLTM